MAEIKNVNLAMLRKTHGANAESIFREVTEIGGFGDIEPTHEGGLDIWGLEGETRNKILKLISEDSDKPVAKTEADKNKKEPDNTATKK